MHIPRSALAVSLGLLLCPAPATAELPPVLQDEIRKICDEASAAETVAAVEAIKAQVYGRVRQLQDEDALEAIKAQEARIETAENELKKLETDMKKTIGDERESARTAKTRADEAQAEAFAARSKIKDEIEDLEFANADLRRKREVLEAALASASAAYHQLMGEGSALRAYAEAARAGKPVDPLFQFRTQMDDIQSDVQSEFYTVKKTFQADAALLRPFDDLDDWVNSWRWDRYGHFVKLGQAIQASRRALGPLFSEIQSEWTAYETAMNGLQSRLSKADKALEEAERAQKEARLMAQALSSDDAGQVRRALLAVRDELGAQTPGTVTGLLAKLGTAREKIAKKKADIDKQKAELEKLKLRSLASAAILNGTKDCIEQALARVGAAARAAEPIGEMAGRWVVCCKPLPASQHKAGKCGKFSYGYHGRFRLAVLGNKTVVGKATEDGSLGSMVSLRPGAVKGDIEGKVSAANRIDAGLFGIKYKMTGPLTISGDRISGRGEMTPHGAAENQCRGEWKGAPYRAQSQNEAFDVLPLEAGAPPDAPSAADRSTDMLRGSDSATEMLRESGSTMPAGQPATGGARQIDDLNQLLKGN